MTREFDGAIRKTTLSDKWNRLLRFSAVSAAITAVIFLIAVLGALVDLVRKAVVVGWIAEIQNNWLMVIIKLHASLPGVDESQLYGLNLLDLSLLILICILFAGLAVSLRRVSKIWSMVALAQPILGILLFIATHIAGRSVVMSAVITASILMLRSERFGKVIGWTGILAGAFLLAGDIGLAMAQSPTLAILTGVGYIALMVWLVGCAYCLMRISNSAPSAAWR